jgi:GNAT superfamily N-acetyltransferase
MIYKLQDVSLEVKRRVVEAFNSEWGDTTVYTVGMLDDTWARTDDDVLLVMLDPDTGSLVGTIGLDHKYFIPIASHLYVAESYRKRGYADVLITELEKQTDRLIYACCRPEKVAGNLRRGWVRTRLFGLSRIMKFVPMHKQGRKGM